MIEYKFNIWKRILFLINGFKIKTDDKYIYLLKKSKTIKTDYKKINLGPPVFNKILALRTSDYIDTTTLFYIKFFDYKIRTDIKMVYDINHSIQEYNKYYKLKPGDIIIDIGGYHGLYSLFSSKIIGDNGLVYCFEPNPDSFRILKENIGHNHIRNIIPINLGLYNKKGSFRFFKKGAGSRIVARSFRTNTKNSIIEVNTTSLSDFIKERKINHIDFIKMDAEGSEIEISQDIKNIPFKSNYAIATYHYRKDLGSQTTSFVEEELRKCGYLPKTRTGEHKITYTKN